MRSIYESGPVPELVAHVANVEQDFVQLSSLDMLHKSCIPRINSVSLDALHCCVCRLGDFLAHNAHFVSGLALS